MAAELSESSLASEDAEMHLSPSLDRSSSRGLLLVEDPPDDARPSDATRSPLTTDPFTELGWSTVGVGVVLASSGR